MAEFHPLCGCCAQIPFLDMPTQGKYHLGSWSRILTSRCRFCQLVKHAYSESCRLDPEPTVPPTQDAILSWGDNPVFAERPAFRTWEAPQQDICFVTQTSSVDRDTAYLRPFVEAQLDASRVLHWISTCVTTNGSDCTLDDTSFPSVFPGLHVLRFIDVMQHCLVEAQELYDYATLSYIWGAGSNFRLTKSELSRLFVPGVMQEISPKLPLTIRDAITLCRMLNVRYLWVDALCLTQDDPEDLDRGVNVMDQVYERAWLTIVAASGTDANTGLPGVRSSSRPPVNVGVEVQPGIVLGVCAGLDGLLEYAKFQEHVLSRRALYFVDNKVFFRCRSTEFSGSCIDRDYAAQPFGSISSSLSTAVHMTCPLQDYSHLLSYCNCRALTNPSDALRAMAGIIRRISEKVKYHFIQGLPSGAFDMFIIFKPPVFNILRRRKGFQSYSWCGWRGEIKIDEPEEDNEWLSKTWII